MSTTSNGNRSHLSGGRGQSSCHTLWGRRVSGRTACAPGFLSSLRSSWCRRLHMAAPRSLADTLGAAEGRGGGERGEGGGGPGQQGAPASGGSREAPDFGGPLCPRLARSSRCCLVVQDQVGLEEEAKQEVEEEEEAEEKALVPVQLLFMTSFDSLFPSRPLFLTVLCPVPGCRLTSTRSGFLWGTTSWHASVFSISLVRQLIQFMRQSSVALGVTSRVSTCTQTSDPDVLCSTRPWFLTAACRWSTRILNSLGDDLKITSLRAPGILQSLDRCLPRPEELTNLVGVEEDFRKMLCIRRSWLYSGYTCARQSTGLPPDLHFYMKMAAVLA